ncbi:MAG: thiamine phosphate synthase [Candidatus Omnitrophica bacterium]|nr:thiamine phosphate synthase [Candidatus Omnitrophota bacterium]
MNKVFRVIDADFNRAREALRTVEDGTRFLLNDRTVSFRLKKLRHELSRTMFRHLNRKILLFSRDSEKDVGRNDDFREKCSPEEIVYRNLQRSEEAIRSLEEYSRIFSPSLSAELHRLRFAVYAVEKEISPVLYKPWLPTPCLCVILNLVEENQFKQLAGSVARGRPEMVQIRYKGEDIPFFVKMTRWLKEFLPEDTLLIVNDRPDICQASNASGVHLGQMDFPAGCARHFMPEKIIGVTFQTLNQAKQAIKERVDYLATGPVFSSPVKPGKKPIGLARLTHLARKIKIPLLAIGGITEENACQVIQTGVSGIAVISAVAQSACPEKTIQRLKLIMNRYYQPKSNRKRPVQKGRE